MALLRGKLRVMADAAYRAAGGTIDGADLIPASVSDGKIAALATTKLTGAVADAQIAGMSASKLVGTVTSAQIASLDGAKLDATSVPDSKLSGTLPATRITDEALTKATSFGGVLSGVWSSLAFATDRWKIGSSTPANSAAAAEANTIVLDVVTGTAYIFVCKAAGWGPAGENWMRVALAAF